MKFHFDCSRHTGFFQERWRQQIAAWDQSAVRLVATPAEADWIIDTHSDHSLVGGRALGVHPASHYRTDPQRTFAWDTGDFPSGRLPGLYASLPRGRFDPHRHRSFCYALQHNQCIAPRPLEEAQLLYGFTGSISSPLRARLFEALALDHAAGIARLRRTDGSSTWNEMFAPGASPAKLAYAEELSRARFVLCPRGNGVASIRLYETLEAGRVPVILSDAFVPPACIDWDTCAVRIPERDLARVRDILREREADWRALAVAARASWEANFSPAKILATLAHEIAELAAARRRHERWSAVFHLPRVLPGYARQHLVRAHQRWQRARARPVPPPPA